MGLFETGIVQVATVGTVSGLIWAPGNVSTSTYGPLGSITVGDTLRDLTILNTGAGTIYASNGSITAAAAPVGFPIPPGGQCTIQGYYLVAANSAVGNVWAVAATGGVTSSTQAGLASVASVV